MAGNNNLELEIHSLFIAGSTPDYIANEIISKYEKNDVLSPTEIESISHFLMTLGRYDLLFKFYLNTVRKGSVGGFPWGFFATSVKDQLGYLPDEVIDLIEFSLKDQPNDETAYKIPELLELIPYLSGKEKKMRQGFEINQLQLKTKWISQLNHNRLYQLHEQEEQILGQLVKNFPLDSEVRLLHQAHLEKKADEILTRIRVQRKTNLTPAKDIITAESEEFLSKLSQQILMLAEQFVTTAPEQIYNLALLCMNFELFDLSLKLLNQAPETFAGEWLKAEILLENGRHLDLLKQIEVLEKKNTATAETAFGAIYLKAQAYFGLGQREIAIQLMESLVHARPSYRSADSLLHEWKTF